MSNFREIGVHEVSAMLDPYGPEVIGLAERHGVSTDLVRHLARLHGSSRQHVEAALLARTRH